MKKALIVANLAGFVSFLLNDIETLQSMGYSIVYAANANKLEWSDTKKKIESLGVKFVQIDFDTKNPFNKENIRAYKQISKLLKKEKFDLIHCHTPIAGLLTRVAAQRYRKKGLKVIYTTHGFAFNSKSSKKSWLIYNTIETIGSYFCDAMITINREDYQNAKKMRCKKVFYINGVGVDTAKYENVKINRSEYRQSIGVEDNQIMILSVGELSDRKNHIVIIDAIAELEDKEKYVFVVCGNGINGGTGDLLQSRAREKGVDLRLLGFRSDIPEITHCSDIGAIPSKREGLGLAGIQSLAAGVPLVGTKVQGIKDYIFEGKTGYGCNSENASEFAQAIKTLSEMSVEEREKISVNCIEVARNFDVSVSKEQMTCIYTLELN